MEVSGAKEGGTESPVYERPLGGRLCDGSLPRPGEPIQPVDGGLVKVVDPEFDRVQNCGTRSFEATVALSVSVLGFFCISNVVENIRFGCGSFCFRQLLLEMRGLEDALTWVLQGGHFVYPNVDGETYYPSELLIAGRHLSRHLMSSLMLKRESGLRL